MKKFSKLGGKAYSQWEKKRRGQGHPKDIGNLVNSKFRGLLALSDHLTCLLRNLHAGQEATELDMEQQTGSKSGKEYVKTIYCHPAYLTYMQSTS